MIACKLSNLKQTRPREYLVRFAFGGAACVLAGLVSHRFGPGLGGLFLAFPAIFPATATLIEAHEKRRQAREGKEGTASGRRKAGVDATGTALGCFGLAGFAAVLWRGLPGHAGWLMIAAATGVWAAVSFALWITRRDRW
jgi:hypothetical protein